MPKIHVRDISMKFIGTTHMRELKASYIQFHYSPYSNDALESSSLPEKL